MAENYSSRSSGSYWPGYGRYRYEKDDAKAKQMSAKTKELEEELRKCGADMNRVKRRLSERSDRVVSLKHELEEQKKHSLQLKQRNASLLAHNETLRRDRAQLMDEVEALREIVGRSLTLPRIETCSELTVKKVVASKEIDTDEIKAYLSAIEGSLEAWEKECEYKECEKTLNDDYMSFKEWRKQQQETLAEIPGISVTLLTHQQCLEGHISQLENDLPLLEATKEDFDEKYSVQKSRRVEMQQILEQYYAKCAAAIDFENKLLQDKLAVQSDIEYAKETLSDLKRTREKGISLIEKGHAFQEETKHKIQELRDSFAERWTKLEKSWYDWDSVQVITFIQYKMNWTSPDELRLLQDMRQSAIEYSISGKSIPDLGKKDILDIFGVKDFATAKKIHDYLQEVIHMYPGYESDGDADTESDHEQPIPERFLCPITRKIMSDPVMALDRTIYEREAIKDYAVSPITNKCLSYGDKIILFDQKVLQEEIDAFISSKPRSWIRKHMAHLVQENGVVETGVVGEVADEEDEGFMDLN